MGTNPGMTFTELYRYYGDTLNESILPFWKKHLDSEYGGVFNILDENNEIVSDDKNLWSQGR